MSSTTSGPDGFANQGSAYDRVVSTQFATRSPAIILVTRPRAKDFYFGEVSAEV